MTSYDIFFLFKSQSFSLEQGLSNYQTPLLIVGHVFQRKSPMEQSCQVGQSPFQSQGCDSRRPFRRCFFSILTGSLSCISVCQCSQLVERMARNLSIVQVQLYLPFYKTYSKQGTVQVERAIVFLQIRCFGLLSWSSSNKWQLILHFILTQCGKREVLCIQAV